MDQINCTKPKIKFLPVYFTIICVFSIAVWATPGLAEVALLGTEDIIAMENKEIKNALARDPGGHWTPDQLLNAKSLEVLEAPLSSYNTLEAATPSGKSEQDSSTLSVSGQNVLESEEVKPDLSDRLFPEAAMESLEAAMGGLEAAMGGLAQRFFEGGSEGGSESTEVPVDAGTAKAAFSSSRLVPTGARLHYPYRTAGKLFFKKPNGGNFICSATVLRPRIILTAGHCVHKGSGGRSGFYGNFLFVPAYHKGSAPYQAWNWRWVITTSEWSRSNGKVPNKADFAIIELEDRKFGSRIRKIGQVTGYLGYRTNALKKNHTKILGYPANHDRGQIMHQVDSGYHRTAGQSTVLYGSDMRGGSSGGSFVENFGRKAAGQTGGLQPWPNRIIGVTSYGYKSAGPKVQGSSILNKSFLRILNSACRHRAGNC